MDNTNKFLFGQCTTAPCKQGRGFCGRGQYPFRTIALAGASGVYPKTALDTAAAVFLSASRLLVVSSSSMSFSHQEQSRQCSTSSFEYIFVTHLSVITCRRWYNRLARPMRLYQFRPRWCPFHKLTDYSAVTAVHHIGNQPQSSHLFS